jgi:predicted AlkP superfamily pyrophosphatase or phosphodiesterase
MGVAAPALSEAPVLDEVVAAAGGGPVDRCLFFAPDALGAGLWNDYAPDFAPVLAHAPLRVALRSAFPPKTPVCFATMFTGAPPEAHGIKHHERPVLPCDTWFDALARAGKRVAIVAVRNSSMDRLFRNRPVDYFSEAYDDEVVRRTLDVLARGRHDVLAVYQQEYDDQLHKTTPTSPQCLRAMRNHIRSFQEIADAADRAWRSERYVLTFSPDHGSHVDPQTGCGTHGADIPEDMDIYHCFGVWPQPT